MTEDEARQLAASCWSAVLENDLGAVAFHDTLRRGLQKWIDKNTEGVAGEEVQAQDLLLVEKCRFPGLEAFLFRKKTSTSVRDFMVGLDEANWVTEFATTGASAPHLESYLQFPLDNPWFHVSGFSTKYRIDGIFPFEASGKLGSNRNDKDGAVFNIKVTVDDWGTLSHDERERVLDALGPIGINNYWLHFKMFGAKRQLRLTIARSRDWHDALVGVQHIVTHVGGPPQEDVLAERFVTIPAV